MTPVRALAVTIARELFTNGAREKADRLVLYDTADGRDLGSWSQRAVEDLVVGILVREGGSGLRGKDA
jgi:hypothetical protein